MTTITDTNNKTFQFFNHPATKIASSLPLVGIIIDVALSINTEFNKDTTVGDIECSKAKLLKEYYMIGTGRNLAYIATLVGLVAFGALSITNPFTIIGLTLFSLFALGFGIGSLVKQRQTKHFSEFVDVS
ncbi:MAG: hypothetical protein BGO10_06730 [Chlamydia sp. 32-24]|nr:MAG: hypothetical protein BGO10_06730 [Chlamydia sp. 32-24]